MSENGEVVPLPDRQPKGVIDRESGGEPRSRAEILKELALALPNLTVLLFRLLRDPRVALRRKVVAAGAAVYVVSPIDLIPDFIPVAGQVDDALIVALAVTHLIEGASRETVERHWPGSEDALELTLGLLKWAAELVPSPIRRLVER